MSVAAGGAGAGGAYKVAELVDGNRATDGTAVAVNLDVGQRTSVIAALDEASDKLGPLDLIVNNAGVTATRRVLDYTDDDWSTVMKTNLDGSWLVAQEAARRLVAAQRPGSIINKIGRASCRERVCQYV